MRSQKHLWSESLHILALDWVSEAIEDYSEGTTSSTESSVEDRCSIPSWQPQPFTFSFDAVHWRISKRLRSPERSKASLIGAFPAEILKIIFYHYVHTPGKPWKNKKFRKQDDMLKGSYSRVLVMSNTDWQELQVPRTTPMHLAHVCSQWRNVTLSTPDLWNKLCVVLAKPRDFPLYEFWMKRSGSALLDLSITSDDFREPWGLAQAFYPIMQVAIEASHRWRTVSLMLGPRAANHFSGIVSEQCSLIKAQSLQSLELDIWQSNQSQVLDIGLAFSHTQALSNVSLAIHTVSRGVLWDVFTATWDSVCELCLRGRSSMCHCAMNGALVNLKSLEVLTLYNIGSCPKSHPMEWCPEYGPARHFYNFYQGFAPLPAMLPCLRQLHVMDIGFELPHLLRNIETPALCILSAGLGSDNAPETRAKWTALEDLVERSHCRIHTLAWGERSGLENCNASQRLDLAKTSFPRDGVFQHLSRASKKSLRFLRTLELRTVVSWAVVDAIVSGGEGDQELFEDMRTMRALTREESAQETFEWVCEDVLEYRAEKIYLQ